MCELSSHPVGRAVLLVLFLAVLYLPGARMLVPGDTTLTGESDTPSGRMGVHEALRYFIRFPHIDN